MSLKILLHNPKLFSLSHFMSVVKSMKKTFRLSGFFGRMAPVLAKKAVVFARHHVAIRHGYGWSWGSNTSHPHTQAACSCSGWPGLASVSTVLAPAAPSLNSRVWACLDHRSLSRSPSFPHPPPLFNPGNHILRGNTDWEWNGPDVKREERPMSGVFWESENASTDTQHKV